MKTLFWALLTACVWGCVPLIEKTGLMKVGPIVGLFYRCLGVLIGVGIMLVLRHEAIGASLQRFDPQMIYLVAGGFLASFLGQIFFYKALKSGEASQVVPVSGAYPLVTFLLGVLILKEKLTLVKAGGAALVILGVILLQ